MNWEIGIDIFTLICIKQITNKKYQIEVESKKNKVHSLLPLSATSIICI